MKKILATLTAIIAVASLSASAFAAEIDANEQAILDYLKGVKIANAPISDELITKAEGYFARGDVSVTSDVATKFIADAKGVAEFCETNGVVAGEDGTVGITELSVLDQTEKDAVIASATTLAGDLDLSFVYQPALKTGYVFKGDDQIDSVSATVKATGFGGFEAAATATGVLFGLAAASAVVAKKRKLTK